MVFVSFDKHSSFSFFTRCESAPQPLNLLRILTQTPSVSSQYSGKEREKMFTKSRGNAKQEKVDVACDVSARGVIIIISLERKGSCCWGKKANPDHLVMRIKALEVY